MLNWLVSDDIVCRALTGYKIQEHDVEIVPGNICTAVTDASVNLDEFKQCFDHDAWLALKQMINVKRRNPCWDCASC